MRTAPRPIAFTLGLSLAAAGAAGAQTIHLPPVFRPVLPKGQTVLTVQAKECLSDITSLSIQDAQVVLTRGNNVDFVPLANRQVRDIVAELNGKAPALRFLSNYLLLDATMLEDTTTRDLRCDEAKEVSSRRAVEDATDRLTAARLAVTEAAEAVAAATNGDREGAQQKKTQADTNLRAAERALADATSALANLSPKVSIGGSPDNPDVAFGFGLVMSPSQATTAGNETSRRGLLSQAGFQLDLTGSHLIWRPANRPASTTQETKAPSRWTPWFYGQARLGLHGNQQLNVGNSQETPGQFESAIQQAQQVALTAQMPVAWTVVDNRLDVVLTPNVGVNWTVLDPFVLPTIRVNNAPRAATDLFPDLAGDVERELNRTLPLVEQGLQTTLHFRRAQTTMFYVGIGAVRKETPVRSVSFMLQAPAGSTVRRRVSCVTRCSASGDPDGMSLVSQFDTPTINFWQIMLGWRMAGLLDLRVDAAGPYDRAKGEPILRFVIGRSFPVLTAQ